jgi:ABC-type lipoprotein export system ATPase subunit
MHTPFDSRYWRGRITGLSQEQLADDYIRRCYDVGLECIGITDHNCISSENFGLMQESIEKLSALYSYKITLLPGFEISADVGVGMHVLALFEPGTEAEYMEHVLTCCGVPMPRQKADGSHAPSSKRLPDIIGEVQQKDDTGRVKGLVVCPHPFDVGLFDNDRISEWLQQIEWKNEDLLAVEVPKPISEMTSNWQKLFANGKECLADWRRIRPMAAVMSSDCKALVSDEDQTNYIGRRWCWIRMSTPSIEALRQAFLDPSSRIRLQAEYPSVAHSRIVKARIEKTRFLADQTLFFSAGLNCLIGGRGSGKSMLLEALRLGLRAEKGVEGIEDHVANRQIKRLRSTFTNDTKIRVMVEHGGIMNRFVIEGLTAQAEIEGREVEDAATVFRQINPIIFSQEEITQLSYQKRSVVDFIDSLGRSRIEPHRRQAESLVGQLKVARQQESSFMRLEGEVVTLRQTVTELARQLEAKKQVQPELKKHRDAQEIKTSIESAEAKVTEVINDLEDRVAQFSAQSLALKKLGESFGEEAYLAEVEALFSEGYKKLAEVIKEAMTSFRKKMDLSLLQHPQWKRIKNLIEEAESDFKLACDEKGLSPEEAEALKETEQEHRSKKAELTQKQSDRDEMARKLPKLTDLLSDLSKCWKNETEERRTILSEISTSNTMPKTLQGKPIVAATLLFSGDRKAFLSAWGEIAPDRRSRLGRIWDEYDVSTVRRNIGDELFDAFQAYVSVDQETREEDAVVGSAENTIFLGNPFQWLSFHIDKPESLPHLTKNYIDGIREVIKSDEDGWFKLTTTRLPDEADFILFRRNGETAGCFLKEDLSTGQKNTAILSLLLARGKGPVLIDQPEDQLDSEFLYHELVPMLRTAKEERQLIIVTHNANIPVNADCELVYALKAEAGRGWCGVEGGLDREDVTQAVMDIMEGSKEAFRRRKEKYHF